MKFNGSEAFLPSWLFYSLAVCLLPPVASLENQTCPTPDVPARGECFRAIDMTSEGEEIDRQNCDVSGEYSPGDEITYSCEEPSVLIGRENITCTSTGAWEGRAPICDKPTNISGALRMRHGPEIITDGDDSTCAWWEVKSGSFVIPLPEKPTVRKIQIFYQTYSFIKGVEVFLTENEKCDMERLQIRSEIIIECRENNISAEFVRIRVDASSFLTICEVEIWNKENEPITITSAPFIVFDQAIVSNWTDGDITTCDYLGSGLNGILFPLNGKVSVRAVRIYAREVGVGDFQFDVFTTEQEKCGTFDIKKSSTQWHLLECQDNQTLGEFVRFVMSMGIYLRFCEVQIFLQDEDKETPVTETIATEETIFTEIVATEETMITDIIAVEETSSTEITVEKENNGKSIVVIVSVSISVFLFGIFSAVVLARCLVRKRRAGNVGADNDNRLCDELDYDGLYIPMDGAPALPERPMPASSPSERNEYAQPDSSIG